MTTPTLIAYDGSGSTGRHTFYHEETQRIVGAYPKDSQLLFWDTSKRLISHAELKQINDERKGGGGTTPALIAEHVRDTRFTGDLVIITDGQASSSDVSMTDNLLPPNTNFNSVTAYLIHTGGTVNMSVTCPFTRRSPHKIYLYDQSTEQRLVTDVTAADLQVVDKIAGINTIAEFEAIAPALEKAVVAATMGSTGDPALRDALLAMKQRIMRCQALMKGDSETVRDLNAAVAEKRFAEAVPLGRALTAEYYGNETEDPDAATWSARISRFISMTEGALRDTFDLSGISAAIRGDRARRAATAATAPTTAVAPTEGPPTFECPITCYEEADVVLLVAEGEPLLAGVGKDVANSLYDCPLNLLNYPELVTALKERLDHPVSLRAFQDAHTAGHPFTTSPMTRRTVSPGGICLGLTEEHCRATTWTLSQLFTGGKLIGNQDFWIACIWLLVERGELPYLAPILPQLRAHMRWRTLHHKTSASLTGVPEFPTTRVPLQTALWYVFASPEFGLPPNRDILRTHLPHLDALQELAVFAGVEVMPHIKQHLTRMRVLLSMLSWVKRDRHSLPNLMLALRQRCVEVDVPALRPSFETKPRFIPIEGAPTEEQLAHVRSLLPPLYRNLTDQELVGLALLVDASKSAGDIALPITWAAPALRPAVTLEWPIHQAMRYPSPVKICPATCRPYYYSDGDAWPEAAQKFYGVAFTNPNKFLSINSDYGQFVARYGIYPTRDEMVTYLYNRRIFHSNYTVLPHDLVDCVEEGIQVMEPIITEITPAVFSVRFETSRPIEVRIYLEKSA